MTETKVVKITDYKPYDFKIPSLDLDFSVHDEYVRVKNTMQIQPASRRSLPLLLYGVDINLEDILINGSRIQNNLYTLTDNQLLIHRTPNQPFEITIINTIDPFLNTSLEGLYSSCGMLLTQCEAEGFRRLCFHPDRPDVLSKYRVRIEADFKKYPILLSNGNQISSSLLKENTSRHEAIWVDPYPKPSYLFALVAGNLKRFDDVFNKSNGESVKLNFYLDKGLKKDINHAVESLKRAMKWDESVYGLEYDLKEYNVVAARHFNMGAMENKSLNIFNSKLVVADTCTATDSDLERIESVIAHEYFHNWTGNRITCRDWFQLSLKEGLTVFRDQSFTAELHSEAVKRIEDVAFLRNTQFIEDLGPTSHPVKPSQYVQIDNFYTTTIYEKGAEVIRMLHTLLGSKAFMSGMKVYIQRFDGQAATTEDFVYSIIEGAKEYGRLIEFNVEQFLNWYYQAGTPTVYVLRDWDPSEGTLTLKLEQKHSTLQSKKKSTLPPLVIPISVGVISDAGKLLEEKLFILDKYKQEFSINILTGDSNPPILSLLRNFSAPVIIESDISLEERFTLLLLDEDPFSRWDAGQFLMKKVLLKRASKLPESQLEEKLAKAFDKLIEELGVEKPGILATLISIPGLSELESIQDQSDPLALYQAREYFKCFLGDKLSKSLLGLIKVNSSKILESWPEGQASRKATCLAWELLSLAGESSIRESALDAVRSDSMTLAKGGLNALHCVDCDERDMATQVFYDKWKDNPVILDSWFFYVASMPSENQLDRISDLLQHPLYDPLAPNAVRAVLGGLAANTNTFHAIDGSGYQFMADQIVQLDRRNPITASRMVKVFSRWKYFMKPHSQAMFNALQSLVQSKLSSNTREVVSLIISTSRI